MRKPLKLSIIIVSYNVRGYLEQCLDSVKNAAATIESEIFVVDNNSIDGSADMVEQKFPEVKLIRNRENRGFSKANNQALPLVQSKYVLFLNPDTLVEKRTFKVCIDFMDSHPDAGAMGVKMIDRKGKFLPESKRSLPTPMVAFYKITGFTAIFPRSERFGRYYLGHLNSEMTHKIDVLTGAFFFTRKEAIDKAGWFDEDFFMYGEDIDLSCRLLNNSYNIYYHPGTAIIHYKGESTRKSSINYVLTFYKAMIIYARKHFDSPGTFFLLFLLYIAIYFRAFLSISKRIFSRLLLPAIDAVAIYTGCLLIPSTWENHFFPAIQGYPDENQTVLIPAIISIWIISVYFSGGYTNPLKITSTLRGLIYGSLAILMIYAMLSTDWYLKTATILPLTIWAGLVTSIIRMIPWFVRKLTKNRSGEWFM